MSILSYIYRTTYKLLMKWGIQEVKRNLCRPRCIPRRNYISQLEFKILHFLRLQCRPKQYFIFWVNKQYSLTSGSSISCRLSERWRACQRCCLPTVVYIDTNRRATYSNKPSERRYEDGRINSTLAGMLCDRCCLTNYAPRSPTMKVEQILDETRRGRLG